MQTGVTAVDDKKKLSAWKTAAACFAIGGFFGPPALAVPIMIDFTNASWSSVEGQSTHVYAHESTQLSLSASGALTFNADDAPDLGASTLALSTTSTLALQGDGVGIGDDEISWGERIDIYFSAPVRILGYYLLDLFAGEGPGGIGELATVLFDDGTSFLDEGTAMDTIGYYSRDVSIVATSISFIAGIPNAAADYSFSDFALGGILIETVEVPEPATLSVFALGLLGLVLAGKRRMALASAGGHRAS